MRLVLELNCDKEEVNRRLAAECRRLSELAREAAKAMPPPSLVREMEILDSAGRPAGWARWVEDDIPMHLRRKAISIT